VLGRLVFAVYLLLIHAVLAVAVVKSDFMLKVGKTLGWLPPEEFPAEWYPQAMRAARRPVAPGSVVLLGDSMVAQLPPALVSGDALNLGIGGDTVRRLAERLPLHGGLEAAAAVVVAVGVNDLKYRDPVAVAADYAAMLSAIPAGPRLFAATVLPVDEDNPAVRARDWLRNERIAAVNDGIRRACAARPDCRLAEGWSDMPAGYAGPDGWHLAPAGQAAWAGLLRAAIGR